MAWPSARATRFAAWAGRVVHRSCSRSCAFGVAESSCVREFSRHSWSCTYVGVDLGIATESKAARSAAQMTRRAFPDRRYLFAQRNSTLAPRPQHVSRLTFIHNSLWTVLCCNKSCGKRCCCTTSRLACLTERVDFGTCGAREGSRLGEWTWWCGHCSSFT